MALKKEIAELKSNRKEVEKENIKLTNELAMIQKNSIYLEEKSKEVGAKKSVLNFENSALLTELRKNKEKIENLENRHASELAEKDAELTKFKKILSKTDDCKVLQKENEQLRSKINLVEKMLLKVSKLPSVEWDKKAVTVLLKKAETEGNKEQIEKIRLLLGLSEENEK